jgi:hypothetical protein
MWNGHVATPSIIRQKVGNLGNDGEKQQKIESVSDPGRLVHLS